MSFAPALVLREGDRERLGDLARLPSVPSGLAKRARMILLADAPHHLTLSTQEAADLLRISRTTLVRLLETGAIPFEKPSRHRKVRLDDLLEYRRRQRHQAELAFADMVADTERLGLYDVDPADIAAALKAARRKAEG
jgi:excisionase family DNA binding protein